MKNLKLRGLYHFVNVVAYIITLALITYYITYRMPFLKNIKCGLILRYHQFQRGSVSIQKITFMHL